MKLVSNFRIKTLRPVESWVVSREVKRSSKPCNELINYLKKVGTYQTLRLIYLSISKQPWRKVNVKFNEDLTTTFEEVLLRDPYVLNNTYSLELTNLMNLEFVEYLSEPVYKLIKEWCVEYKVDPNSVINEKELRKLKPEVDYYLSLMEEGLQRRKGVVEDSLNSIKNEEKDILLSQVSRELMWVQPVVEMANGNRDFNLLNLIENPEELLKVINSSKVDGLVKFINKHKLQIFQGIPNLSKNSSEEAIICWNDESWVRLSTLYLLDMFSLGYLDNVKGSTSYLSRMKEINLALWERWNVEAKTTESNPAFVRLLQSNAYPLLEFWVIGYESQLSNLGKAGLTSLNKMLTEPRKIPKNSIEENLLRLVKNQLNWEWLTSTLMESLLVKVKENFDLIELKDISTNYYQPYLRKHRLQEVAGSSESALINLSKLNKVIIKQPWLTYRREENQEMININQDLNVLLFKHVVALKHVRELREYSSFVSEVQRYDHGKMINLSALAIILRFRQRYDNLFVIEPNRLWLNPCSLFMIKWSLPRFVTSSTGKVILGVLICSFSQSVLTIPFVWTSMVFFSHFVTSYILGYVTLNFINIFSRDNVRSLNLSNRLPSDVSIPAYCRQQLMKYLIFGLPFLGALYSFKLNDLRIDYLRKLSRLIPEWMISNPRTSRTQQAFHDFITSGTADLSLINPNVDPKDSSTTLIDDCSPVKNIKEHVIKFISKDGNLADLVEVISNDMLSFWEKADVFMLPGFTLPFLVSVNVFCNLNVPKYRGSENKLSSIKSAITLREYLKVLTRFNVTFVGISILLISPSICFLLSLALINLGVDPYLIALAGRTFIKGMLLDPFLN